MRLPARFVGASCFASLHSRRLTVDSVLCSCQAGPPSSSLIDSAKLTALISQSEESVLLPSHVYARLQWTRSNQHKKERELREKEERKLILDERSKALYQKVQAGRKARAGLSRAAVDQAHQYNHALARDEHRIRAEDDAARKASQKALVEQVRRRRELAQGRVAASRMNMIEHNRHQRRAEALNQQFALDEKARRLVALQEEHRKTVAKKFVPLSPGEFDRESYRLLHAGASTPLSSRALMRPMSAPDFRHPALSYER